MVTHRVQLLDPPQPSVSVPHREPPPPARVGRTRALSGAIQLTSPEIAERLSVAGTPEECVAKLRSEIVDAGGNHLILAIIDAALVKA